MTYESIPNLLGAYKVVLEERAEGVYVNVIESPFVSDKKAYPVRILIILLSSISALVFGIIAISVIESKKETN